MRLKVALFSMLFISSSPVLAFAVCTPPSAPSCTSAEETYNNKETYTACQTELEAHHKASLAYIDCMKKDLEETAKKTQADIDKVSDKTNALIKEFNCKSGNKEEC